MVFKIIKETICTSYGIKIAKRRYTSRPLSKTLYKGNKYGSGSLLRVRLAILNKSSFYPFPDEEEMEKRKRKRRNKNKYKVKNNEQKEAR